MKAIIKYKKGLVLGQVPMPLPKSGEVLVKVAIAGYCRTDAYVANNKIKTKTPLIPGHEFSGTVEKIGKAVTKFKKGDRVAVMPILPDRHGYYSGDMIGVDRDGAFAEYVSVPEVSLYKISPKLRFKDAAYLEPVAASLAVLKAPIRKKQRGFVLGDDRIAKLTHRIISSYGFKFSEMISLSRLKRRPDNFYDFAIETFASSENLAEIIRVVRPGGVIVLKSRGYAPVEIPLGMIVRKDLRLHGTYYGKFKDAIHLLESGKLKVNDILGPVLDLEDAIKILKGDIKKYGGKKLFFKPCAE